MASTKPVIFISHVHEDAQIAHCLKQFLDEAFLGSFNIFVSSDGASIRVGDNWSSSIEQALTEADIVFALVTDKAKDRRWIHFECGGAYFARKRVVPICCRSFPISELSPPLSWLQAINGTDCDSVTQLIEAIAQTFDLHKPKCDVAQLASYLGGSPCDDRMDRLEVAKTKQKAFPIFLVIDTSASMSGEPIERLSVSIRKLLDDLLQTQPSSIAPLVSIISFGSEAREIVPLSPLSADTLKFTLQPSGTTALGSALRLLASRLADDSQMPPQYLRPMIVVFTDGQPTDDWRSGLNALNQSKLGRDASRICVAFGEMADLSVLKAIAAESVISVPDITNIGGLSSFFTWMSTSVRILSESEASTVQTDLPPLTDWNSSDP
jgi:uncharacterized protein YegL